jgi:hypothetical protein
MHSALPLLAALALPVAACAQDSGLCEPESLATVDAWLAAHPWRTGVPQPDERMSSACKPWPEDRSVAIVAATYDIGRADRGAKNTVVALVDTRKGAVLAAYKGVIVEVDDLRIYAGTLSIDTARYDLARGVRAFGVDVTSGSSGSRAAESGYSEGRTLFMREGRQLRPVLSGFLLHSWTWPGHEDPRGPEIHSYTLAIGKHASHGFADLIVTDTIDSRVEGGPPERHRYPLQYDGSRYVGADTTDWGIEPEPDPRR